MKALPPILLLEILGTTSKQTETAVLCWDGMMLRHLYGMMEPDHSALCNLKSQ